MREKDDVKLKEENITNDSKQLISLVRKLGHYQIESVVPTEKSEESEGL
jgi:hypothetical protein